MNVSELFQLVGWFDKEIIQKSVVAKYGELISLLSANAQPNQPKVPFEVQKNNLNELLDGVTLDALTHEQIRFLEKLGLTTAIGREGGAQIDNILFRNSLDIATAINKLNEMLAIISATQQRFSQISTGLSGLVGEVDRDQEDVLLRIEFTGEASLNNVVDLKDWANAWHEISRGITMAHKQAPESVRIVGASNGSIILDLLVAYAIAKTTSQIILEALNVADRVLEIRKKAEELRGLKLKNDKLAQEVEQEAETEKDQGANRIVEKLVVELNIKRSEEGDVVLALEKSVSQLIKFVTQGGVVDVVLAPEPTRGAEEASQDALDRKELRAAFSEIRQLENKLRLIENRKLDSAEDSAVIK